MESSKLITVVVWATIVLVLYELYKSLSTSQLGGGTTAQVQAGLTEDLSNLPAALAADSMAETSEAMNGITGAGAFNYAANQPWNF